MGETMSCPMGPVWYEISDGSDGCGGGCSLCGGEGEVSSADVLALYRRLQEALDHVDALLADQGCDLDGRFTMASAREAETFMDGVDRWR